jgi:enoyl-CoA hydratase/carnithine racemase
LDGRTDLLNSFAGIATHYIHSSKLKTLLDMINKEESPERALQELHEELEPPTNSIFVEHRELIDDCFSRPAVEEIMEALKTKQSKFAADTLANLSKMSPLSLKVTFRGINLGGLRTIEECFQMESRMSSQFMRELDFYEGVRAILVDKDRNPKWNPSSLIEISEDRVQKFFDPSKTPLELDD